MVRVDSINALDKMFNVNTFPYQMKDDIFTSRDLRVVFLKRIFSYFKKSFTLDRLLKTYYPYILKNYSRVNKIIYFQHLQCTGSTMDNHLYIYRKGNHEMHAQTLPLEMFSWKIFE